MAHGFATFTMVNVRPHRMCFNRNNYLPKERMPQKKVLKFLAAWLVCAGVFWSLLEIAGYLGFELLQGQKTIGLICIVSISLNLAFLRSHILQSRNLSHSEVEQNRLPNALLAGIQDMSKKEDWLSILRIATPISRALWLEGEYRIRVELGKLVEDAAARTGKRETQVKALIDDIGWTSVALGDLDKAASVITRGVQLARENGYPYLAAKGQRHLAAIALYRKTPAAAVTLLDEGETFISNLADQQQKEEMRAGYAYARAEAFIAQRNFDEAEKSNQLASSIYKNTGDNERYVKTFSQNGRIQEGKGQKQNALDTYRRGLSLADHGDRKDEAVINLLLIARLHREQMNPDDARRAIARAKELLQNTSLSLLKYIPDEIAPLIEETK